jgi:hypothetical protein
VEADAGAGVVVRGIRLEGSGGGGRGLVVRGAVVVAGEVGCWAEGGVVWAWTWRGGV